MWLTSIFALDFPDLSVSTLRNNKLRRKASKPSKHEAIFKKYKNYQKIRCSVLKQVKIMTFSSHVAKEI